MSHSILVGRLAALVLATTACGAFAQSTSTTTVTNKSETSTMPAVKVTPPSVTDGGTEKTTVRHHATHPATGTTATTSTAVTPATGKTETTSKSRVATDGSTVSTSTSATTR